MRRRLTRALWFGCAGGLAMVAMAAAETKDETRPEPRLSRVDAGAIEMRVAEMGSGPLVLLLHGFPDFWYTWRHQLPALAAAGYRAVAPDMRGYGESDAPAAVEDYDMLDLCGDVVGLMDALGEESAVLVGHDWGAAVAWYCSLLAPERVDAVVALSVPWSRRGSLPPLEGMRRGSQGRFFYMLYFQEPGPAEKELAADLETTFLKLLPAGVPRQAPKITDPEDTTGGWLDRIGLPKKRPDWLKEEDLAAYVETFAATGFRGGLNYYRNFDRSWQLTPQLEEAQVSQPALFLAGELDSVLAGRSREQLAERMRQPVPHLQGVQLFPGAGHWVHQQLPEKVNERILAFLDSLGLHSPEPEPAVQSPDGPS